MLQLNITILVGLATLASTQNLEQNNNKAQEHSISYAKQDGRTHAKVLKRSAHCCSGTGWEEPTSEVGKRAWSNIQPSWGKRKWQDIQSPGWGKRSSTPIESDQETTSNLPNSFQEDKRGWRDMQGPAWGKRGWKDMQTSAWGKRGWKDMQATAWGKRGWQDMQGGNWGKRSWQGLQGSGWGKRGWKDMQSAAWGKRGWKELQSSGWGKRDSDDDDTDDNVVKRGWGDMKISGYGKRAWNDIQSSGWGKRGWKQMQSTGWGKRSPQQPDDVSLLEEDWELPLASEVDNEEIVQPSEWPTRRLLGSNWRLYEPNEDQTLMSKVLEGLRNSSWENQISKSDRAPNDEPPATEEHTR